MADNEAIINTGTADTLTAGADKLNVWRLNLIKGDGTANRALRCSLVAIKNAALANKIKPSMSSVWNGDAVAEENNLGKSADTGNFNLDSTGAQLHIEAGAITGNAIAVLMSQVTSNSGGDVVALSCSVVNSGITISFSNATDGSAYDLTEAVDNGEIYVQILYLTST